MDQELLMRLIYSALGFVAGWGVRDIVLVWQNYVQRKRERHY